jgi:hypothetical protein
MMFCPDCNANLDDVPAEDPCPACGGHRRSATVTAETAKATASAGPVEISIDRNDYRPWEEQWLRVLRCLARLRAAYSPEAVELGNAEVEDRAKTFFEECDHLRNWLKGDVAALPGVTEGDIDGHWRGSETLLTCNAISRTQKHHTPDWGKSAGIRRTVTASAVGITLQIETDWASESATTVDALELAEDCVKSWRGFFANFGIVEP